MRYLVMMLLMTCHLNGAAQTQAKERLYTDVWKGMINGEQLELSLTHCRHCDDGTFVLKKVTGGQYTTETGDWTVLRGSATHRNATVVNLYGKAKEYYFLRRKDGMLQQLDSERRELKPATKYLLKKL